MTDYVDVDPGRLIVGLRDLYEDDIRDTDRGLVIDIPHWGIVLVNFCLAPFQFTEISVGRVGERLSIPSMIIARSVLAICHGDIKPGRVNPRTTFPCYLPDVEGMVSEVVIPIEGINLRILAMKTV